MTNKEMDEAANIFNRQAHGESPSTKERAFLHGLLDKMEAPERAGTVAAIITIMLEAK